MKAYFHIFQGEANSTEAESIRQEIKELPVPRRDLDSSYRPKREMSHSVGGKGDGRSVLQLPVGYSDALSLRGFRELEISDGLGKGNSRSAKNGQARNHLQSTARLGPA